MKLINLALYKNKPKPIKQLTVNLWKKATEKA